MHLGVQLVNNLNLFGSNFRALLQVKTWKLLQSMWTNIQLYQVDFVYQLCQLFFS